jgi:putative effector of murein hydrolase
MIPQLTANTLAVPRPLVLTFAAVRRTLAIGALAGAGIHDLGTGDPMRHLCDR